MKGEPIEINHYYDIDADALFIHKVDDYGYDESVELTNDIIMDFDIDGNAVALEILNVSKVLKVPKFSLKKIDSIHMAIGVDDKLISLKFCIGIFIHQKELTKSIIKSAINDFNLPPNKTELLTA